VTDPASLAARLAAAGCVAPEEEAAELLAAAPDAETLERWVARRSSGVPLPWLTGRTTFAGLVLHIDPGVYVPRPQTEELARRAAGHLPPKGRAVDLCTGSGAVAAALRAAAPEGSVVGVDLDEAALRCAAANGVPTVRADVADALPFPHRCVDVVTAVAPYVPTDALALLPRDVVTHEPRRALDGGPEGLTLVHRVVHHAAWLLRPGGWLLLELGGDQSAAVSAGLRTLGFSSVAPWHDDEGDGRGVEAHWAR